MRLLDLCRASSFAVLPIALVALLPLLPSCASTHADTPAPTDHAAAKGDGAKADAAKGEDDADEKESKEDKIKKKERELDDNRVQLKIARQECDAATRKQKDDVTEAEYNLAKSREALEHFQKITRNLEYDKAVLSVDMAKNRVEEQKQNLEELMSLYKAEDFATVTKDKVISRGQAQFDFANRNLTQDQTELASTRDVELPRKEKDLQESLHKAENKLREENAELAKLGDENELKLRKAERAVDETEKALNKMKSAKDTKDAKVAKP